MTDRELRDELEQLDTQVKSLRAELASFDVARRVAEKTQALTIEIAELEAREVVAARAPEILGHELKQLEGELLLAASSLKEARRAVDRLSISKTDMFITVHELRTEGCLPVLALVGAGACWWWVL